jgi:hypothetical protein
MPVIAGAKKKSKKKGSIANVPPKLKPWIRFIRKYGGKGYTREELSKMYRKERAAKKRTAKKTTGKKKTAKKTTGKKKTTTRRTTRRTTRTGKKRKSGNKVRGGAFIDYETDEE